VANNAADNASRLQELLDKQDIHECLLRMSRGSDRYDRTLFLSGFHADATVAAGPYVGDPAGLYDWSSAFQQGMYARTFHKILNHLCDLDGDQAHAETYYLFVGCLIGGDNLLAGGRYVDRFERRDGRWGLVMRNNFVEWTTTTPALESPLGEIPDLHLNGLPAFDRSDPSYQRPLVNKRALFTPGG